MLDVTRRVLARVRDAQSRTALDDLARTVRGLRETYREAGHTDTMALEDLVDACAPGQLGELLEGWHHRGRHDPTAEQRSGWAVLHELAEIWVLRAWDPGALSDTALRVVPRLQGVRARERVAQRAALPPDLALEWIAHEGDAYVRAQLLRTVPASARTLAHWVRLLTGRGAEDGVYRLSLPGLVAEGAEGALPPVTGGVVVPVGDALGALMTRHDLPVQSALLAAAGSRTHLDALMGSTRPDRLILVAQLLDGRALAADVAGRAGSVLADILRVGAREATRRPGDDRADALGMRAVAVPHVITALRAHAEALDTPGVLGTWLQARPEHGTALSARDRAQLLARLPGRTTRLELLAWMGQGAARDDPGAHEPRGRPAASRRRPA